MAVMSQNGSKAIPEKTTSNGANAVAVVVYGNRDYEKSLEEAGHLLRGNGFKVTAGATFIGEHSYSTPATPIATGRPDAADLEAEKFGAAVKHKIENGAEEVDLSKIERGQFNIDQLEISH